MIFEQTYPVPRSAGRPLRYFVTRWQRFVLLAILTLAAVLDFYGLSREGYGNTYYAAAVKSMMQNWHAFFFNSLDSAGFVSIDKPPLGFWLQVASAKIFGYSGIALMLPQALAGVCSVALLYYLVSRIFGRPAGLIAALALALTPVSVVANRNNIVDSTLVLAVLAGAWAVSRAVKTGKLRWLLLCALFVGLGFNIKMLEAFLVLPAFGLMYLLGARIDLKRRLLHLLLAGIVLLGVSLSWLMAVDLTPASQRPWVGSTTDNSALSLAIGYNGLQRLTGRSTGGAARFGAGGSGFPGGGGGGPGGVGENGPTGPLRLLDTQLGGQIGWLLPLAVIGLLAGAWETRRRKSTSIEDGARRPEGLGYVWRRSAISDQQSALILWGMWFLTMVIFFDIAAFYHTYYLVMLAPAIAALSGVGITSLWRLYRAESSKVWGLLPLTLLGVAAVETHLLAPYPDWSRWLSPLIWTLAVIGALILCVVRFRPSFSRPSVLAGALLGLTGLLVAPAVWSAETATAASSSLLPRAGPAGAAGSGGFGTGGFGGPRRGEPLAVGGRFQPPSGRAPGGGDTFRPPNGGRLDFRPPGGTFRPVGFGGRGGVDLVNAKLVKYLEQHQGTATYLFGTTGASTAEPYIIATGKPVMALGGFSGSDPILSTAKLAKLTKQGKVRYFLLGGRGGGFGGDSGSGLATWIQHHSKAITIGADVIYEYTG